MGSPADPQHDRICEALFAGKKIEAIKLYRELSGQGLRESKDFVEGLEARLREQQPERFTKADASGGGCAPLLMVLLGIVALAGVWWLVR
ncbi:MAG: ribosomal protein L7/L12 [Planctomycetia bacterium]|nr:ribosomal protein L7/L12 [Planctomycetia bacterium]